MEQIHAEALDLAREVIREVDMSVVRRGALVYLVSLVETREPPMEAEGLTCEERAVLLAEPVPDGAGHIAQRVHETGCELWEHCNRATAGLMDCLGCTKYRRRA